MKSPLPERGSVSSRSAQTNGSRLSRRRLVATGLGAAALAAGNRNLLAAPGRLPRTATSARAQDTERPVGGELKVGLSNEPPNLDPHQASALIVSNVNGNIFDPLVYELADGTIAPHLAESWEIAPDGLTATFKLRQGVTFHDGEPFNAAAMKKSFDRMVDPATQSGLAASLLGPYTGSEAVDDATIRMSFSRPFAPLLRNLSRNFTAPVSPKAIDQYGLDVATNPVGTGPFRFKEWVQKDHLTLERNPDYNWAPAFLNVSGPAALDGITWRFIAEEATRIATLRNGESNIIESMPPAFVQQFEGDDNYAIDVNMNPGIPFCFMVNTQKAPTDQIEVRQAMEYGIDKEVISQTINFGVYPPAPGALSPITFGYWPGAEQLYGHDVERARALLDQAGWTVGGDGVRERDGNRLTVQFYTLSDIVLYQNIAQVFQAQMQEIGIAVEIVSLARAAWGDGVRAGEHNLTTQIFGLSDPSVLAINFHSKNIPQAGSQGFNWARYSNPELDKLLDDGEAELDPERRVALYQDAQRIILENATMIPVYLLQQVYGRQTRLAGLTYLPGGQPLMYTAYLQE